MAPSGQGFGESGTADPLLVEMLGRAVPVAVAEMRSWEPAKRLAVARERWAEFQPHDSGSGMGRMSGGTDLRYGGRHAASEFASLATVLAALAYSPGGVTFAGLHWCTDHAACEAATAEARRRLAA